MPANPKAERSKGVVPFRAYQRAGFRQAVRRLAYLWRRQGGKSYLLGNEALDWMMECVCLTSIISAAIALGTEVLVKEAQSWRDHLAKLKATAAAAGLKMETNADAIDFDGFCDLFEHSKLEAKLFHDGPGVFDPDSAAFCLPGLQARIQSFGVHGIRHALSSSLLAIREENK